MHAQRILLTVPLFGGVPSGNSRIAVSVATPPERWAYAFVVPLPSEHHLVGPLTINADISVLEGVVGLGWLDAEGQMGAELELEAGQEGDFQLGVREGGVCKSLVIRNVSTAERPSRVEVAGLAIAEGEPRLPEVHIDDAPFAQFTPWAGVVPAGFWMNWLGCRTRPEVWHFSDEVLQKMAQERHEQHVVPVDSEHVLDWSPLIDAVAKADECFVMVALGAGWGRWLTAGAAAAKQTGRDYRLVGVEAEPTHYEWLQLHMKDNDIDPDRATLLRAAASPRNGACWFYTGEPDSWYGQSIVAEALLASAPDDAPIGATHEMNGYRLERTRCIDLATLAADLEIIDYVHMDIQGTEADFLEAYPDVLQRQVRMVNVGTHSHDIERRLRRLFGGLGWQKLYDVPRKGEAWVRLGQAEPVRVQFGDGVQVWRNPAISN